MSKANGSNVLVSLDQLDQIKVSIGSVEVPEWSGLTVYVRALLTSESDLLAPDGTDAEATALVCAKCICDEHGKPLDTDAIKLKNKLMQREWLGLQRVFLKILEVSGAGTEAIEAAKKSSKEARSD